MKKLMKQVFVAGYAQPAKDEQERLRRQVELYDAVFDALGITVLNGPLGGFVEADLAKLNEALGDEPV